MSVGAAGLGVTPHDTSVSTVPAGLILKNRGHLPRTSMTSLAAQLVQRTFLGYDLDLRPGAVGAAFTSGAQFYLDVKVKVARDLTLLRSLEAQFPDRRYIPDDIILMWRNNEYLRRLAIELGTEPSTLRTLLEPEIARDQRLSQLRMQDRERRGPDLDRPDRGMSR